MYATYNGTTTAQQQGLGLKDRHGARDAADVSRVLGTFFSFFGFLDYTNTFTVYSTYYSNNDGDNNLDQGDECRGLEMLQTCLDPQVRVFILFFRVSPASRVFTYLFVYIY